MKCTILILLIFTLISCDVFSKKNKSIICEIPIAEPKEEQRLRKPNLTKSLDKMRILEVKTQIPKNFNIVNTKEGKEIIFADLDSDGQEDAVCIIEMVGDTTYDQSKKVMLAIFTRDRHGELRYFTSTENLGGEAVMYNDNKNLSSSNGVISYFHQSMRHDLTLKFRYDIHAGDFMLIGKDYRAYGSIDEGPILISFNYLTGMKLIDEMKWDDEREELVSLPQQKAIIENTLVSLSAISFETMYNDL